MRKQVNYKKLSLIFTLLFGGIVSLVTGQYYYFEVPPTASPYKQWCETTLDIKATTESNITWAKAGLLRLQLNPTHFSYNTSDIASVLQTQLFVASTASFSIYSNPSIYPAWLDTNRTILQIDRYNPGSNFVGTDRLYGTLKLLPKHAPTAYTWIVSMIYNGDTIRTSLSYGGNNIINPTNQNAHITWSYYVEQSPCQDDFTAPANTLTPFWWTQKSHLSWIHLSLTENAGGGNVPYIWTGGLPGSGTWTGNIRWINNQYGVNLSTFKLRISGNGTGRYFTGGMFSSAGDLIAVWIHTTWQFYQRDYSLSIASWALFDYGIEKLITITGHVSDRKGNVWTIWTTFNAPVSPWLIGGSTIPNAWATMALTTTPITLGIADDRAGVHSGTIIVTISGVNGTAYGPFVFSGSDLNLSGVPWTALQPDYYITINHTPFPSSWTIHVSVYAEDMVGNVDTISDYSFRTKPSCSDYGCFHDVYIQTGNTLPFIAPTSTLSISGGINPYFTGYGNTWTIYCGTENEVPMSISRWTENQSGSAIFVSLHDASHLTLSGNVSTVKAILSGKTLYLEKIYTLPGGWGNWGGGWWGWGWNFEKDACLRPDSNFACANTEGVDYSESYYDNTCCAPVLTWHGAAWCDISDSPYTDEELNDAFQRSYDLNITNKCPIDEARLEHPLIRMEAAKMMTMFTVQVIGIYPDTHKVWCDTFTDTQQLSSEMKFFTKTACQLNLMGLKSDGQTPDKQFNPYDQVNRAQFGTILSRLIYGNKYNIYSGEDTQYKWYEKHLQALNKDTIMKKIQDPFMIEQRWRVMLMLYRIYQKDLVAQYRLVAPAHNWAIVLLENIR